MFDGHVQWIHLKVRDDTLVSGESALNIITSSPHFGDCFSYTPSIVSATIDVYNQYNDGKSTPQPSMNDLESYLEDLVFSRQ